MNNTVDVFFLTNRHTGNDLAQSFATPFEAADFLQTLPNADDYDITRRETPAQVGRFVTVTSGECELLKP